MFVQQLLVLDTVLSKKDTEADKPKPLLAEVRVWCKKHNIREPRKPSEKGVLAPVCALKGHQRVMAQSKGTKTLRKEQAKRSSNRRRAGETEPREQGVVCAKCYNTLK